MLPLKENLNFPKVKSFLSSLGLSAVEPYHLSIVGRLQFFVENWQVVTNDPWVISATSEDHIPFTIIPHQGFLPSHKVSVEDGILIDKELGELIQKQAIHPVSENDYNTGFVSNLFVIPKMGGGQRPVFESRVLYCSNLEMLLKVPQVSLERHSVGVRMPSIWNSKCPPRFFAKILKPVIGLLRKQGIRLIIYLDDFLLMASPEKTLSYHVTLTVTLLEIIKREDL